jgi:DNA gyrase subunit A
MPNSKNNNNQNPDTNAGYIKARKVDDEMRESYIDYAMSVIVSRALPDVRDGLKPVHRRILYAMNEEGLYYNAKFRKSATVVGSVLGRYHPHGDMAVYDSLVRMAQDFSLRYPLVQGQGNFGCFTKDTKVQLTDGRSISFGKLIQERKKGKRHWTFSFNHEKKKIEITEIKKPRLTRKNASLVEVKIDNGEKIRCTPDHKFMLRNGRYKEAQYLKNNDSLMPLYIKPDSKKSNVLNYFENFEEMMEKAETYNHKVLSVKFLKKKEDVYDITVNPWHNFLLDAGVFVHNSIDNDPPAAQRYTECRLSKIGQEMLKDIHKETVDFIDNYDGTRKEPTVLPAPVPQLLLNGSLGIAVGMATSIPPHNLGEVCDAAIYLIDNPKATTEDLFQFIKGPDFPTGGMIFDQKEIITAYSQGRGPILIRGKADIIETKKGDWQIVISEIPYAVNKSFLVAQIAKLVQEKEIKNVKDARDESDREGMRIVLELKKDAFPQKILNRLYKSTDLQKKFHLNMIALVGGIQPKTLSLSDVLNYYLEHRHNVVLRRSEFELNQAKKRAHILEGLIKCLFDIDKVIALIKKSKNREEAKKNLMKTFKLTGVQAEAVLETKLAALARLEREKIEQELKNLEKRIKELTAIINSPKKIKEVVKKELKEAKEAFGDERRTKVYIKKAEQISEEDLVAEEETLITMTNKGYIKRLNPSTYKAQHRGGKGIAGMKTADDDFVERFLIASTLDKLLFFTDSGKVFCLPAYEIPQGNRTSKGRALVNFLEIGSEEKVLAVLPLGKKDEKAGVKYLCMVTKNGIIKKTPLEDFQNIRSSGLIAVRLKAGDLLRSVKKSSKKSEIIIATKKAQTIRFKETQIRPMQRNASGNRGVRLKKDDEAIGMEIIEESRKKEYLMMISEKGYGKRTKLTNYRLQTRGGSGIKTAKITKKTGDLVRVAIIKGDEDVIIISRKGQVIRTLAKSIPAVGRVTQGVRIMKLTEADKVISLICL